MREKRQNLMTVLDLRKFSYLLALIFISFNNYADNVNKKNTI